MLDAVTFQTNKHEHSHAQNRFAVIPTDEKLKADLRYAGRGVCVAFLDSGFYPHADFAERVVAFHDIAGEEDSFHSIFTPKSHHWHGTQTVVSCAGNGFLSDGVYRGIASEARLVLVKVSNGGRISDESIEKGLQWILENREKYNIRVLNMSLGGDMDATFEESRINQLAEELINAGVCITVAAGNSAGESVIPPANCPSVITVGGFSDENQFSPDGFNLYHSNFGTTLDGVVKPEIIAPAMFVAAPILPATEDYRIAETLSTLANMPDYVFRLLLEKYWKEAGLPHFIAYYNNASARELIDEKLRERKIVAAHYQHVDGTSFAAPITASVIAQMLEANPNLTPASVKNILTSTASRLENFPAIRQGFGVLNAKSAVEEAVREIHFFDLETLTAPRVKDEKIIFTYHDDSAETVHLAGDFNDWRENEIELKKSAEGVWIAEIPHLPKGEYLYKFIVNRRFWTEDTSNGMKREDGFGGFNSILIVE